jgi:hypothetical protein
LAANYNLSQFLDSSSAEIKESLLVNDQAAGFVQVAHAQLIAWDEEIAVLKEFAQRAVAFNPNCREFGLVLEYRLPRRERRIDAALLFRDKIVLLEFKVGGRVSTNEAVSQITDYALDLHYYHGESRPHELVSILCPTQMAGSRVEALGVDNPVKRILVMGRQELIEFLVNLAVEQAQIPGQAINHRQWVASAYVPIPGILEATVELFTQHEVDDITSSLAESVTIDATIAVVAEEIRRARETRKKVLCLITGAPGAGKTLTGLRIAHDQLLVDTGWHSVFLSGNGPLLKVLQEALARDYSQRKGFNLVSARNFAKSKLHSVHSYLHEVLRGSNAPAEQVVIFDEAQRAWDAAKMKKMAGRQRRLAGGVENIPAAELAQSEPAQILMVLSRHQHGAVLIALCGNGQEIHDGEAGVAEWVTARSGRFEDWRIVMSPVAMDLVGEVEPSDQVEVKPELHLSVPMRSHRATRHAAWVDAVLNGDSEAARRNIAQDQFPIVMTRDLPIARQWLARNTLGSRRKGLVASSGAYRLRPYGVEVSAGFRKGVNYAFWFTAPDGDLRSSHALEVVATEFECQGLELDRVGVCWCWDMLLRPGRAQPRVFHGKNWRNARAGRERQYIINKYRVLLTRAREGMVIWVPRGEERDKTRISAEMDGVESFLKSCGVAQLD